MQASQLSSDISLPGFLRHFEPFQDVRDHSLGSLFRLQQLSQLQATQEKTHIVLCYLLPGSKKSLVTSRCLPGGLPLIKKIQTTLDEKFVQGLADIRSK